MQNLKTQVFKIFWSILKRLLLQAHLVAAFEQSLGNMTIRLKSLTLTAEQKVKTASFLRNIRVASFGWPLSRWRTLSWMTSGKPSSCWRSRTLSPRPPLMGSSTRPNWCLKETKRVQTRCKHSEFCDIWRTNTHYWLFCPIPSSAGSNSSQQQQQQNQQPDLRIRRQHSSDSVSSINSATSHSSVGSNMDADAKNKKKNKKNWVRRDDFKQLLAMRLCCSFPCVFYMSHVCASLLQASFTGDKVNTNPRVILNIECF